MVVTISFAPADRDLEKTLLESINVSIATTSRELKATMNDVDQIAHVLQGNMWIVTVLVLIAATMKLSSMEDVRDQFAVDQPTRPMWPKTVYAKHVEDTLKLSERAVLQLDVLNTDSLLDQTMFVFHAQQEQSQLTIKDHVLPQHVLRILMNLDNARAAQTTGDGTKQAEHAKIQSADHQITLPD